MIIFCQWDFNEQIEKLVRLLLYTSENCSRKFQLRRCTSIGIDQFLQNYFNEE